jgi:hypothetical protein
MRTAASKINRSVGTVAKLELELELPSWRKRLRVFPNGQRKIARKLKKARPPAELA